MRVATSAVHCCNRHAGLLVATSYFHMCLHACSHILFSYVLACVQPQVQYTSATVMRAFSLPHLTFMCLHALPSQMHDTATKMLALGVQALLWPNLFFVLCLFILCCVFFNYVLVVYF
jgi:hypothetical protein